MCWTTTKLLGIFGNNLFVLFLSIMSYFLHFFSINIFSLRTGVFQWPTLSSGYILFPRHENRVLLYNLLSFKYRKIFEVNPPLKIRSVSRFLKFVHSFELDLNQRPMDIWHRTTTFTALPTELSKDALTCMNKPSTVDFSLLFLS